MGSTFPRESAIEPEGSRGEKMRNNGGSKLSSQTWKSHTP